MTGQGIPRIADDRPDAPLSCAQEGIWLTERAFPQFARYTGVRAFSLLGALDTEALARAVVRLGRRHEGLGTTVTLVDGVPRQFVRKDWELPLEVVDLRAEPDPSGAGAALVDTLAVSRFDLAAGPLFRALALRTGPDSWTLLLVAHHIVIDLLSWPILLRDLGALYQAETDGRTADLADLPIRPCDYAAWQRRREHLPEVQERIAYWQRQLAEVPALLDVPTDRQRARTRPRGEGVLYVPLPPDTGSSLAALARSERTTLLVAALAGLAVLLSRYTRQERLTVGVPVAGDRFHPEVENLVGMFVGSFPVPVDLRGAPSFRRVIDSTRQAVLAAMTKDVPYELLVQALKPDQNLGTVPYQQVSLNIRYPQTSTFTLPGLEVTAVPVDRWFPLGDLTLTVDASKDPVDLVWIYDSELFDQATVAAMADHYNALLTDAVGHPDRPVADLALASGAPPIHGDRPERSPEGTIPSRFAAHARRTPDALAVASSQRLLTYRELESDSDAVAASLRQRGVRREDTVGVHLKRGTDLVTAYLGILKAHAAYVPLDPDQPDDRLAEMLRQSGARWVITDDVRPWCRSVRTARVDELLYPAVLGSPPHDDSDGHPDALAYVMFTSGSAGSPKGVAITHRGVLGLVIGARHVRVTPADRVAQTAALSSDNTTFEIWAPLLNGASVHILDRDVVMSPRALAKRIATDKITILSVASAIVNHEAYLAPLSAAPLAALHFGGEAANPHAVRSLLTAGFTGEAVHTYGPTETTMLAAYEPVTSVPDGCVRLPVGHPVSATEIHIMDGWLRPLPPGVPGELCVGGDRLARGYADLPGLTADRFVPNPLPGRAGERLYRTGDLARRLPDGRLEILGRIDRQLKVRGYRVEPGEIEAVLTSLPDVAEAVVTTGPSTGGSTGLVAHVSARPGRNPSPAALRRALRELLPEYMVPSAVVVLPRLPLTSNGKVDHRSLPPASREAAPPAAAPVLTPRERLVADLAAELLEVESVGRDEEFRDLGGTSLFLVHLATRLEEMGIDIPIADLLTHQTVTEVAAWPHHPDGLLASPAREAGAQRPTLVLVGVEAAGFSYGPWLSAIGDRHPRRLVDVEHVDGRSLASLAVEHVERLRDSLDGAPVAFAGWSAGGTFAHEMARVWHEHSGGLPPVLMIDASARPSGAVPPVGELIAVFLSDVAMSTGVDLPPLRGDLTRRTPREAFAEVIAALRARGAGYQLDPGDLLARFDAFTAVTRLVHAHTPTHYAGAVTYVQAADSPPKSADWAPLCGSLEVTELPGNHYTVLRTQPARLAELGAQLLRQAGAYRPDAARTYPVRAQSR